MGRYRKRKSAGLFGDLMDLLIEVTGFSWKFGGVVSVIFLLLSGWALKWAHAYNNPINPDPFLSGILAGFGWLAYLIPIMLFLFAGLFLRLAWVTYNKQRFY